MTPLRHRFARALSVLAALALPALAAAPIDASAPSGLRRASTPVVDTRHARVIVKFKADGALMRESAQSARDPDQRCRAACGSPVAAPGHCAARRTHGRAAHAGAACRRTCRRPIWWRGCRRTPMSSTPRSTSVCASQRHPTTHAISVGQTLDHAGGSDSGTLRAPDATIVSAINAEAAWDITARVALNHRGRARHWRATRSPRSGGQAGWRATTSYRPIRLAFSPPPTTATAATPIRRTQAIGSPMPNRHSPVGRSRAAKSSDSTWHGTQTAALIGAATNNGIGMASVGRNVRIMPVRVLGKCGGFVSDVVAGMCWAAGIIPTTSPVANPFPAKVLNLSLGSTRCLHNHLPNGDQRSHCGRCERCRVRRQRRRARSRQAGQLFRRNRSRRASPHRDQGRFLRCWAGNLYLGPSGQLCELERQLLVPDLDGDQCWSHGPCREYIHRRWRQRVCRYQLLGAIGVGNIGTDALRQCRTQPFATKVGRDENQPSVSKLWIWCRHSGMPRS